MDCHVCGEHHLDDHFSYFAVVNDLQMGKDIELFLSQEHEGLRNMMILEDALIVVEQGHLVLGVY